jgi:hypothetical protein
MTKAGVGTFIKSRPWPSNLLIKLLNTAKQHQKVHRVFILKAINKMFHEALEEKVELEDSVIKNIQSELSK